MAALTQLSDEAPSDLSVEERRQRGLRPNMPAYNDTPLLTIGKRVRVLCGERHRRADIECVDEADGTVEVAYVQLMVPEDCQVGPAEETVPASRLRPLEAFELESEDVWQRAFRERLIDAATKVKENANALFKLKDYDAAAEQYTRAIAQLRKFDAPSSGSLDGVPRVLVNHGGALACGTVQSVNMERQLADVSITRDGQELRVVAGVPWRALVAMHEINLTLQSSLHMNRARAFSQLGCHAEAAQDLTLVISFWIAAGSEDGIAGSAEVREQLMKAHYLRSKSRLARLRLGPARADLQEAWGLEPPEATAKLLQVLERELEVAQREQLKSNKRLAKEIAKLADQAFTNMDPAQLAAMGEAG